MDIWENIINDNRVKLLVAIKTAYEKSHCRSYQEKGCYFVTINRQGLITVYKEEDSFNGFLLPPDSILVYKVKFPQQSDTLICQFPVLEYLTLEDRNTVLTLMEKTNLTAYEALRLYNEDLIWEIDMLIDNEFLEHGLNYFNADLALEDWKTLNGFIQETE